MKQSKKRNTLFQLKWNMKTKIFLFYVYFQKSIFHNLNYNLKLLEEIMKLHSIKIFGYNVFQLFFYGLKLHFDAL